MKIIGLTGPKGVGKTTTAQAICDIMNNAKIISFAEGVYEIAGILSTVSQERLANKSVPFTKEETIPSLVGITPRQLLQKIGTEMVREKIGKGVWVELMLQKAHQSKFDYIIVDDCRFDNEAKAIDLLIKLRRDGIEYTNEHRTEQEINADYTLYVNGTPQEAAEKIVILIYDVLG